MTQYTDHNGERLQRREVRGEVDGGFMIYNGRYIELSGAWDWLSVNPDALAVNKSRKQVVIEDTVASLMPPAPAELPSDMPRSYVNPEAQKPGAAPISPAGARLHLQQIMDADTNQDRTEHYA
jgi:hypothetical protein